MPATAKKTAKVRRSEVLQRNAAVGAMTSAVEEAILETALPKGFEESLNTNEGFYSLVHTYYKLQKARMQFQNANGAMERTAKGHVEKGIISEEEFELIQMDKAAIGEFYSRTLLTSEKAIVKVIRKWLPTKDIYGKFLHDVRGIGPILAAAIISTVERHSETYGTGIEKYANISKLWSAWGVGVYDGERQRRVSGKKVNYDPFMKTICWKIGESFVKSGGYYREQYDRFRKQEDEKNPDKQKLPAKLKKELESDDHKVRAKALKEADKYEGLFPAHKHERAKRKTVKLFLADLWMKWRELEGLPVTDPYIIAKSDDHNTLYRHP